jgi:hypothetical protein
MNNNDDQFACGLDGEEEDPVTIGRFNRWVAVAVRHHMIPVKKQISDIVDFQAEEREMHSKILGGIMVIKWLIPVMLLLVSGVVIWVVVILHRAGVL